MVEVEWRVVFSLLLPVPTAPVGADEAPVPVAASRVR